MTTTVARPTGCLPPVLVGHVTHDPESVRSLAKATGPFFMPARYLVDATAAKDANDGSLDRREVPSYLIGPVWRGDWAFGGELLVEEAEALLHHPEFISAAQRMYNADVVAPEQVYINLSGPMNGTPFSHVDIPEFVGIDRTNAPGWFLQAMGSSGLFEDVRITIVTAVAWFHDGPRGYFRYWPVGREARSVRHETMWNTAVVGDNDFMHHKVERIGTDDAVAPEGMTIDTQLDHDGDQWRVFEGDRTLASYDDANIRLSVSWKAKVFRDEATRELVGAGVGGTDLEAALARFAGALDGPLAASGADALQSPALRDQLTARWSGYVMG